MTSISRLRSVSALLGTTLWLAACGGGGGDSNQGPLRQAYDRIQTCNNTLAEVTSMVGRPADDTSNGWVWFNDEEVLGVYIHRGSNNQLLSIGIVEYTRAQESTGHLRKDICNVVG